MGEPAAAWRAATDKFELVEPAGSPGLYTWRPLRLLAVYRLLVSVTLMLGALSGYESVLLAAEQPVLFQQVAVAYSLFALVLLILSLQVERHFLFQVCFHTLSDILLLGLLIYSVGLEDNGLRPLMIVAVAGGSVMVGTRLAALFAAVASLTLLFQHLLQYLQFGHTTIGYTQVGLLGLVIFVAAITASLLAARARENAALAEERGIDLANQQTLNGHIVQRLHDGALVVDGDDRIRLINKAGWELLGRPSHGSEPELGRLCRSLHDTLRAWRKSGTVGKEPIRTGAEAIEVRPRFIPLGERGGTLIFLEDMAELRAEVQRAKLVSLGKLTASIAHEIRNPLSAMSHAAQLLEEAELTDADRRLLKIIRNQGRRLNDIIENVLRMSRRGKSVRETFLLRAWLQELLQELSMQHELQGVVLDTEAVDGRLLVDFDPGQLRQVINNLLRNAAEHAGSADAAPAVRLAAGYDAGGRPWLEVADNGAGVAAGDADHLFEPFFTTAGRGTGLGLYLCRELCESNEARISLRTRAPAGACFRITFAGPVRTAEDA